MIYPMDSAIWGQEDFIVTSVEPLHNSHPGDRRKWTLKRGLNKKAMYGLPAENVAVVREVAVRGGLTVFGLRVFLGQPSA